MHTITEKSIVSEIRQKTAYLVMHEKPEDQQAARLSVLMEAAEEEAQDHCPSSTVMLVRKTLIHEAMKCVKNGGLEHGKMLDILTELLESYAPLDHHQSLGEQQ